MGCDIHLNLEEKITRDDETLWVDRNFYARNEYYPKYKDDGENEFTPYWSGESDKRNYLLFAILANVRNDGSITPIAEPRGLPADMNSYIAEKAKSWEDDGHSMSYFTLQELEDANDDYEILPCTGYVTEIDNVKLKTGQGVPTFWYTTSNDRHSIYAEWDMEITCLTNLIADIKAQLSAQYRYVQKDKPADNFRIVFWFDN